MAQKLLPVTPDYALSRRHQSTGSRGPTRDAEEAAKSLRLMVKPSTPPLMPAPRGYHASPETASQHHQVSGDDNFTREVLGGLCAPGLVLDSVDSRCQV